MGWSEIQRYSFKVKAANGCFSDQHSSSALAFCLLDAGHIPPPDSWCLHRCSEAFATSNTRKPWSLVPDAAKSAL